MCRLCLELDKAMPCGSGSPTWTRWVANLERAQVLALRLSVCIALRRPTS